LDGRRGSHRTGRRPVHPVRGRLRLATLGALRSDADTAKAVQLVAYPNQLVVRSAVQPSYVGNGVTQLCVLVEINLP
jgi:hypothetical protein